MGSPTTSVTLTVLNEHVDEALRLLAQADERPEYEGPHTPEPGSIYTHISFAYIREGRLEGLQFLTDHGIAFDAQWDREDQIEQGTTFCRFTEDGQVVIKEVWDSEYHIAIADLLLCIDDVPALLQFIRRRDEATHVLPWDNQAEYGKRYLVMQMLK